MTMINPTSPVTLGATGSTAGFTSNTGSASSAGSGSSSSETNALASLANPSTFLQLLIAQLQNQDPLDPMTGTQFMSQTAQMAETAMVDQLVTTEQQIASEQQKALAAQQLGASTSLIGKQVTAQQADGSVITGTVSGVTVSSTSGPMLEIGSALVPLSAVSQVT